MKRFDSSFKNRSSQQFGAIFKVLPRKNRPERPNHVLTECAFRHDSYKTGLSALAFSRVNLLSTSSCKSFTISA